MNAKITPRIDVLIPKPRVVTVGPRIEFFLGPVGPQDNGTKRTFDITLKYSKKDADGNQIGIPNKKLSIETSGVDWTYVPSTPPATNLGETNDDGLVDIVLTREFAAADTEKKPIPVSVTGGRGFVSGSATFSV